MSNIEASKIYELIVENVINEVREDFENAGIDEQALQDLKRNWQIKLTDTKVTSFSWDELNNHNNNTVINTNNNNTTNNAIFNNNQQASIDGFTVKQEEMDQGLVLPGFNDSTINSNSNNNNNNTESNTNNTNTNTMNGTNKDNSSSNSNNLNKPNIGNTIPIDNNSNIIVNNSSSNNISNSNTHNNNIGNDSDNTTTVSNSNDIIPKIKQEENEELVTDKSNKDTSNNSGTFELTLNDVNGKMEQQLRQQEKQAKRSALLDTDEVGSELDDSDDDYLISEGEDDGPDENLMLCLYDKVTRTKARWKCSLKDGIVTLNRKDFTFKKAQVEAEWV